MSSLPVLRSLAQLQQKPGAEAYSQIFDALQSLAAAPGEELSADFLGELGDLLEDWTSLEESAGRKLLGELLKLAGDLDQEQAAPGPEMDVDTELLEMMLDGALERLADMQELVLAIDTEDVDAGSVEELRRIVHTFKGELGVLSLAEAQGVCHAAEDLIDETQPSDYRHLVDPLLAVCDWLEHYTRALAENPMAPPPPAQELRAQLQACASATPTEQDGSDRIQVPEETLRDPALPDFLLEVGQCLDDIESDLLELALHENDREVLGRVYRAFHTISGVASFLHLADITRLTRVVEGLARAMKAGQLECEAREVDLILEARDMTAAMVKVLIGKPGPRTKDLDRLIGRILAVVEPDSVAPATEQADCTPSEPEHPAQEADTVDCLIETGLVGEDEIQAARKSLEQATRMGRQVTLFEILVEQGFVSQEALGSTLAALHESKPAQDSEGPSPPANRTADSPGDSEPLPEKQIQPASGTRRKLTLGSTVKVDTERLDSLVDMVGELVIAQQMLLQHPELALSSSGSLNRNLSLVGKITRDLQEASMGLRMVTFHTAFQKIGRLVRDVAKRSGKEVQLVIEGAETEVDRNVVEKINDPLVHLVRNAIDHGMEPPEVRAALGKPRVGTLHLRALQSGGSIVIQVQDDGSGLNRERILERALEQDLVPPGQDPWDLPDEEVFGMIFASGFSTAQSVTDISGRGVGMDVVRKNIESMRGRIDIDSEPHRGTCFSLRLPLTLAIIDGMVVRAGAARYVIPTLAIQQTFQPHENQVQAAMGEEQLMNVRGELVSIRSLGELMNKVEAHPIESPSTVSDKSIHVLVRAGNLRCCLMVDEVIGQQQIVIKNLGKSVPDLDGVAGGAILGDGRVALIVDVEGLLRQSMLASR